MFWNSCHILESKTLLFSLLILCIQLTGCSTLENGRRWGEDVTITPGWEKIGRSARDALTSPVFYLPAAAALLLQIDHADRRISDWAMEHTPVYGSQEKAEQRSEDIRGITAYAFYLSILATPGGNEPVPWAVSKAKGALVQQSAVGIDHLLVNTLKDATGRERPDKGDDKSFPSSRSSSTAVFTTLASRNIDTMNIPRPAKTTLDAALSLGLIAVSWARVEAGAHYPSDVLAGISLGYFISSFMNDSFMGLDQESTGMPVAGYNGKELFVGYQWRF